jgi:lysophospholipase L1-like esterase
LDSKSLKARCLLCNYVDLRYIKNPSKDEEIVMRQNFESWSNEFRESHFSAVYRRYGFDDNYVREVVSSKEPNFEIRNGVQTLKNMQSTYANYIGGFRVTTDTPANTANMRRVFCFGNSVMRGSKTDDSNTIPSFLQRLLNDYSEDSFIVYNCSNASSADFGAIARLLKTLPLNDNDIIIIMMPTHGRAVEKCSRDLGFIFVNNFGLFDRPHKYGEVFVSDVVHMNHIGYEVYAKRIFETLEQEEVLEEVSCYPITVSVAPPPPLF